MSRIRNVSLHAATFAGAVGSALAIGGGVTALASVPDASPAPARAVTMTDCSGHQVRHPSSFILACGDADTALARLHWRHWGAAQATATGTEVLDLCTPDCADGHFARFPVTVTATRVRHGRYTRLVVHAGAHCPKGVPVIESWTPVAYR